MACALGLARANWLAAKHSPHFRCDSWCAMGTLLGILGLAKNSSAYCVGSLMNTKSNAAQNYEHVRSQLRGSAVAKVDKGLMRSGGSDHLHTADAVLAVNDVIVGVRSIMWAFF